MLNYNYTLGFSFHLCNVVRVNASGVGVRVDTVARAMKVLRGGSVVLVGEEAEKQKGDAALQKFAERAARLYSLVLRVALDLVTGLVE